MQRLSLSWIVERLRDLESLSSLTPEAKGAEAWRPLYQAQTSIAELMGNSIYVKHLKVSSESATALWSELNKLILTGSQASLAEFQVNEMTVHILINMKQRLETVLLSELHVLPVFLITPKEVYDLNLLISEGTGLFPPGMASKVPETYVDALEAGRCLAFERNTACGFHVFRVVESVLRRYWDEVSAGKERPQPQALGNMSAQLEICNLGDPKVIEALKQLAKLHRNPISHPDVILTSDEAIAAIGMARSVVTHMLLSLKELPPTTTSSSEPATA